MWSSCREDVSDVWFDTRVGTGYIGFWRYRGPTSNLIGTAVYSNVNWIGFDGSDVSGFVVLRLRDSTEENL